MTIARSAINQQRARLSGLSRDRLPGDPAIADARAALANAQQNAGLGAVLKALRLRNSGATADEWIRVLKVPGVPLGIVLLESVELLAYLIRHSDRPDELLAALGERVNPASD